MLVVDFNPEWLYFPVGGFMKKKRISIALFLISIGFLTSCASTHSSISVDVPEDSTNEPSNPDSSISSPDVSSDMAEEVSSSLDSSGQETEGEESSWQTFGRLPYEKLRYLSEMKDEKKNYSPSLRDVSANFNAYENKPKILNASYPSRLATVTVTTEEEDGDKSYVGYLLDYVDGRIIESYPSAVPVSSLPVTTVSGLPLVIVSKPDNNTYSLVDLAGNYLLSYLRKKPTPIHVVTRKEKDHFVYDFILEDESIGRKAFESYLDERTGCYFFKEIPFSSYPMDQELRPLTDLHINSKGYYVGSIENGFYLYGPEKNYLNCIIPASFPINEANVASTNYIYTDSAIYYTMSIRKKTERQGKSRLMPTPSV